MPVVRSRQDKVKVDKGEGECEHQGSFKGIMSSWELRFLFGDSSIISNKAVAKQSRYGWKKEEKEEMMYIFLHYY